MTHAFNPNTWEAEASLVYKVSSRTARATQRNPVSKNQKKKKEKKEQNCWGNTAVSCFVSICDWKQKPTLWRRHNFK